MPGIPCDIWSIPKIIACKTTAQVSPFLLSPNSLNKLFNKNFSEFHSGYRAYKTEVLKKINFMKNSNDFYFDSEIIIQMAKSKFTIKEIPIATIYGDEISNLNPIPYGINVLITTIKYKFFERD